MMSKQQLILLARALGAFQKELQKQGFPVEMAEQMSADASHTLIAGGLFADGTSK